MNRGSDAVQVARMHQSRASMRPRFMNRGSEACERRWYEGRTVLQ